MQGDETSTENVGCCQREGCQNPAVCNCKGCGEAHYCSMGHAMEDWKNHVIDCNLNISQLPDDTLFVTEFNAKTQEGGPAEWTPVDMIHMRATPDGGFTQMTFNEDASAKIAEQDNLAVEAVTPVESAVFAGKTVFPGSRINQVPGGQKRKEGMATVTVIASSNEYSSSGDLADFSAVVPLKDNSIGGGQGTTVALTSKDLNTVRATGGQILRNFANSGRLLVALTIGAETHHVMGVFSIPAPSKRGVTRLARRAMGQYDVVRVFGMDNGTLIRASLKFERDRAAIDGNFILTEVRIHVPKATARTIPAGASPGEVFAKSAQLLQTQSAIDDNNLLGTVNAEVTEDVLALADVLADMQDDIQSELNDAQINAPQQAVQLNASLQIAARLRNSLEAHAAVLADEESQKVTVSDIDPQVHRDINSALVFIEAPSVGRFASERLEEAKFKRSVGRMRKPQLYARWKELVDQTQILRDAGQVGSHTLRMAKIAYQRLTNKGMITASDTDFAAYAAKYRNLIATEGEFRKGKKSDAKAASEEQKEKNRQKSMQQPYPISVP